MPAVVEAAVLEMRRVHRSWGPRRSAHFLTMQMALQLRFYVIQTKRQYVRPFLAEGEEMRRHLQEVNTELGYDVVPEGGPIEPMVRHFRTPVQVVAAW